MDLSLARFTLGALALPAFSPALLAGEGRLAYSRLTEGYWQIWVCDPSGSDAFQVTTGASDKHEPAWIHDGSALVYCDGEGRLFRYDLDRARESRLLERLEPFSEPHLSTSGKLVYQRVRQAPGYLVEVWVAGLDGHDAQALTRAPLRTLQPSWSPDGLTIAAIQNDPEVSRYGIVALDPGSGSATPLFGSGERLSSPTWSPDGRSIAFARDQDGNNDVWILAHGTKEPRRLTSDPALDAAPVFSPDGSEVLFVSLRSGSQQLWRMPLAGGRAVRVTNGEEPCREPAWWGRPSHPSRLIRAVELSRRTLDPVHGDRCDVGFEVTEDGPSVGMQVVDAAGRLVREIAAVSNGPNATLSWDGRDVEGRPMSGLHYLRLVSEDPGGDVRWDPARSSGGELVSILEAELHDDTRQIEFVLEDLALVRARIGIADGPLLSTPMNWEVQGPGAVRIPVTEPSAPGWPSFWLSPERRAWVSAWRLPANAVWVVGPQPLPRSSWMHPYRGTERNLFLHALHAPDACRDIAVSARVVSGSEGASATLPLVGDSATIRVDAATAEDRALLEGSRFEVMLYVDGQFLMEDEDSALPYSFTLDVSHFPEGHHSFLAVVAGYQDHQGSAFAPFRIERGTR